jgi:hypothetical protein
MAKEKEIARAAEEDKYLVLAEDSKNVASVLRDNLGIGGQIRTSDFDRIKVPSGGQLAWMVPGLEGETPEKTVSGILIYWRDSRVYWEHSFSDSGGGSPPQCSSDDGIRGIGDPGGECAACPLSQWGEDGEAQACRQVRVLFLLRPDAFLPVVVSCPPTSIAPIKKYFMRLASKGVPYYGVITQLGLESTQSVGGIKYARIERITRLHSITCRERLPEEKKSRIVP